LILRLQVWWGSGRLAAGGGRAVIAGKANALAIFKGGGSFYVSRGAHSKRRVGGVRPVVAVWRRGRQDAALKEKTANRDVCGFFYLAAPGYVRGLSLPL
jgi:hypothetical protein